MRRFMLFALFAMLPLACSTQTSTPTAKQATPKPAETADVDPSTGKSKPVEKTPVESGWVQLFNGTDFTGWKKDGDAWKVENGVLIGNSPVNTYLVSDKEYQNFHVRMEAKVSDQGDSGLYFRCQPPKAGGGGKKGGAGGGLNTPKGYEAQINNNAASKARTGSLTGGGKSVTEQLVKPADDWFKLEVIADGDHIRILVNDKQTADHTQTAGGKKGAYYTKGYLAIQAKGPTGGAADKKGGKKGGGGAGGKEIEQVIYVRKLEIKELPATPGK